MGVLTGNPCPGSCGLRSAHGQPFGGARLPDHPPARLMPEQVGLPPTRSRRVPGLRRSEVAALAGLSVEYSARLERGQIAGASSSVLEALARALHLDETERAHLYDLARAAAGIPPSGGPRRRPPTKARSRLSLQAQPEAITDGVAFVRDPPQSLLAANA